jgi:hypothetical protein
MITPGRFQESLAAVCVVGARLHARPDPVDWLVVLGVCGALLPLCPESRPRNLVLAATAGLLSALYLIGHIPHMLAAASLMQ